jgi:hypothetical protein
VNAPCRLGQITPAPTPAEAAAIVAALERFARDTAPSMLPSQGAAGGWLRAARLEAVGRAPGRAGERPDWHPWRERARVHPAKH